MYEGLKKNRYPGKYITFEGIDGSGKSDQFKMLHDLILAENLNVIFSKEPPNNTVGVEIYDILRGHHPTIKLEEISELEMQRKYFLARRMLYQDVYLPALKAGVHLICDRGLLSVAYGLQDITQLKSFLDLEKAMFDFHHVPFITPDLNLIYDVPVEVALDRLGKKDREKDKFEQKEKLETARRNYLSIGEHIPNCVVIDGNRSVDDVFIDTKKNVFEFIKAA